MKYTEDIFITGILIAKYYDVPCSTQENKQRSRCGHKKINLSISYS